MTLIHAFSVLCPRNQTPTVTQLKSGHPKTYLTMHHLCLLSQTYTHTHTHKRSTGYLAMIATSDLKSSQKNPFVRCTSASYKLIAFSFLRPSKRTTKNNINNHAHALAPARNSKLDSKGSVLYTREWLGVLTPLHFRGFAL